MVRLFWITAHSWLVRYSVVLNNRVRFQLSDEEIAARRLFVEEARRQIQAWQSQMTESGPQERLFKGNQRQWNKRRDADKNATSIRNQNSHFIDHEMQMQEHVLEQQDQGWYNQRQESQRQKFVFPGKERTSGRQCPKVSPRPLICFFVHRILVFGGPRYRS